MLTGVRNRLFARKVVLNEIANIPHNTIIIHKKKIKKNREKRYGRSNVTSKSC